MCFIFITLLLSQLPNSIPHSAFSSTFSLHFLSTFTLNTFPLHFLTLLTFLSTFQLLFIPQLYYSTFSFNSCLYWNQPNHGMKTILFQGHSSPKEGKKSRVYSSPPPIPFTLPFYSNVILFLRTIHDLKASSSSVH